MEIYRKITPTCLKESIERKEKLMDSKAEEAFEQADEEENGAGAETPENENLEPQNPPEEEDQNLGDNLENNLPSEQENATQNDGRLLFESQTPYPEIVPSGQNLRDIRRIKMLNFGRNGALTSFLTSIFQNSVLPGDLGTLKEVLSRISEVELNHYVALSNAVVSLGGSPTLTDGRGNVWTGRNVPNAINPKRILELNVKAKQNEIDSLYRAARETENESLRLLFLKIAEDNELHLEIYEKLLEVFR